MLHAQQYLSPNALFHFFKNSLMIYAQACTQFPDVKKALETSNLCIVEIPVKLEAHLVFIIFTGEKLYYAYTKENQVTSVKPIEDEVAIAAYEYKIYESRDYYPSTKLYKRSHLKKQF